MAITTAEFEEKEFEHAVVIELGEGGFAMGGGQVLERAVGYDAVAAPNADFVLWQLLQVPAPEGVVLVPELWQLAIDRRRPAPNRLPTVPVSLITQFKRPEHVDSATAGQWHYWDRPYFRFACSKRQHATLQRLEQRLRHAAVVRYCSPAFHLFAELQTATITRSTLSRSGWVSPLGLRDHLVWTYAEPGTAGYANPKRKRLLFMNFEGLQEALSETPAERALALTGEGALWDHLTLVARGAARELTAGQQRGLALWQGRVRRLGLLSEPGVKRVTEIATVVSVANRLGVDWRIADAFNDWV